MIILTIKIAVLAYLAYAQENENGYYVTAENVSFRLKFPARASGFPRIYIISRDVRTGTKISTN